MLLHEFVKHDLIFKFDLMAKPYYTPGPYHTKEEFMTNRFVSAIGGNVKLDFSWADRHQIRFFFHDEPPLFGIFGGTTGNFEVFLERDKVDSMDYVQVTIILLNVKTKVVQRWHRNRLLSLLKSNRHFNLISLYSARILDLPDVEV